MRARELRGQIHERLFQERSVAPATEPEAATERVQLILRALELFEPFMRVRALELELGFLELSTGLWSKLAPEAPVLLARTSLPPDVACTATVKGPERVSLPSLDTASLGTFVRDALAACVPPTPTLMPDWRRIETLAVSARLFRDFTHLQLSPAAQTLEASEDSAGRWFTGPLNNPGLTGLPPLALRFEQDACQVRLELAVAWSPWMESNSPERAALDAARASLLALGFEPER